MAKRRRSFSATLALFRAVVSADCAAESCWLRAATSCCAPVTAPTAPAVIDQVGPDVPEDRQRRRLLEHLGGQAPGRPQDGVGVARCPVGGGSTPLALVHDGQKRRRRRHVAGPQAGGDRRHVGLQDGRHRGGTPGDPRVEGGKAIRRADLGQRRVVHVRGPRRVEGVVGGRVVGRTTLGGLPLVEIGHVRLRGRRADPLEDAQFPAVGQRGDPARWTKPPPPPRVRSRPTVRH